MRFSAPRTREERNMQLKERIGVTWEENEPQEKTLLDIKAMLVAERVWHTEEDQFLRRTIYTMQANRRPDWRLLFLVCFAGGFAGVCFWVLLVELFGLIPVGVPIEEFMGF